MLSKFALTVVAGTLVAAASPAFADTVVAANGAQQPQASQPSSTPAKPESASSQATLSPADLDKLRGGEEIVVSDQNLNALTTGNLINGNNTAGNVSISDMAFSNFNGVGNILINTGSQNSLQTGMNLTINVNQ
ncbi:MAG TPA: hypothetical protein VFM42_01130 [Sphingomicrobium sp.]|jgi:hypothetical protein|nr:hypothetical protein [Sphingomicrobium sp.]